MSRSSQLFARVVLGSCLAVAPMSAVWSANPVAVNPSAAGDVLKYEAQSGETYLAIGLRAKDLPAVKQTRNHVVLIDTSASQFGEHRTQGFALLQAFLRGLPSDDQVSLFAVDVQAVRLTAEFVPADSDAVRAAMATLRQRAPLGATNFQAALEAAIGALPKEAATTVLYIGDGMSSVNLLGAESVRQSVAELRQRQVPFSSYAVGPKQDLRLLGVMAQHTGGVVLVDGGRDAKTPASDADIAGRQLAQAATESVFFPDKIEVAGAELKLASDDLLPLRGDRETIVLAQGGLAAGANVSASGKFADQPLTMQWSLTELPTQKGSSFLATAFKVAGQDKGLIPYAGHDLLTTAWNEFDQRVEWLTAEGNRAAGRRQFRDAVQIGKAIQELDPQNVQAKLLVASQPAVKVKTVSRQAENAGAEDQQPAADSLLNRADITPDEATNRSLILDEVARGQIIGEKLKLEVSRSIEEARALTRTEPQTALTVLKRAYGSVKSTEDASIDLRQQLGRQLQGVIAEVRSQMEVAEQAKIKLGERVAVQESEKRLLEKLQLEDEKLENLIDRVRALLEDGARGKDAAFPEAEAAAAAAVEMRPNSGVAVAARFNAEAAYQLNQAFRLRQMRADKFLAVLEQVELSHIPFPDEPPVLYPAPEIWKQLTERRRQYASVDLHKSSPAERRIQASLDEQTEISFTDTPLSDVIVYLQDYHNIPIIIDTEKLNEEGIATDSPVTRTLAGVKLRSALKIILQPLALAYVIEDEVMKITTADQEKNKLQTRVYPVGDLVVQLMAQGGMGGGGQQGGQQGGGGQGGGGQGGGGFGGGGQGGGGGGFFNVPANGPILRGNVVPFNNQQINGAKKKPSTKK